VAQIVRTASHRPRQTAFRSSVCIARSAGPALLSAARPGSAADMSRVPLEPCSEVRSNTCLFGGATLQPRQAQIGMGPIAQRSPALCPQVRRISTY
jgi:hypothetical protein